MYLIANMSAKKIHINDMNLYVDKKQVIDLDRLRLKIEPAESKDLKNYVRKGTIKELNRPGRRPAPPPPPPPKEKKPDNKKLVQDIKRIIVDELDKRANTKTVVEHRRDSSDDVLEALSEITSQINVIKEQGISLTNQDDTKEEEPIKDLDPDTLADIHARAVDKMTKETIRSVKYKEKEIIDPSLLEHASELEDII